MTNREAHEDAAGMGLDDLFFRLNDIDPNAEYQTASTCAPSTLTLDKVIEACKLIPPVPSMSLLIPAQARMNASISAQLETMSRQFPFVPIYESPYLPRVHRVPPARRNYKTRRGYRMARNFWRGQNRRVEMMAFLISQDLSLRAGRAMDELVRSFLL